MFPVVVFYCADIHEGNELSGLWYGTTASRPGIQCFSSLKKFESIERSTKSNLRVTFRVRDSARLS